ncbi:exosortase/archaeosortase family protein [bacterium]|nr:exosortase/archaeosortase family protein [bacterium]
MKMKPLILILLWAIAFYPLYPLLFETWMNDSNSSHGILVPLISTFLIWRMRPELEDLPKQTDLRGLLILIASMSLYILSYAGGVTVISRCMIVFSLIGLVLYNFGPTVLKVLAFPLLFLIFMIPVPVSLIGLVSVPLQRLATDVSAALIRLVSIPVYQDGNMLYFAQTQLEVAEACSGIQSITAMLMLGAIFVYMNPMSNRGKVILLALTIPVAMSANIVRVTGTGILAHFYGSVVATGFLHEFSGMVVFVFGLSLMMIVYKIIQHIVPLKPETR